MKSNQRRWLAVGMMMLATLVFGTDLFSAQNTRPIIRWVMSLFFDSALGDEQFGTGEGIIRKSAHFLEYAILAWLWFRAVRGDSQKAWHWRWATGALLAAAGWAAVDELQQGFISSHRTGDPWDVLLDASGAAAALTVIGIVGLIQSISTGAKPTLETGHPANGD
jgi:VanZ family protein